MDSNERTRKGLQEWQNIVFSNQIPNISPQATWEFRTGTVGMDRSAGPVCDTTQTQEFQDLVEMLNQNIGQNYD